MPDDGWRALWAKTVRDDRGCPTHWLPLHQHLDDTEGVAGKLVDEWVAPLVLNRIAADLPDGGVGVRRIACWLAAVHDVGKASPAFAVQVPRLADHARDNGFRSDPRWEHDPDRSRVSHGLVGHIAVKDWLAAEMEFSERHAAPQLACAVGGHHGVPPESSTISMVREKSQLVGKDEWQEARYTILRRAVDRAGGPDMFAAYRDIRLSRPSQALLTAIVIMADWIASNDDLFGRRPMAKLDEPQPLPDDAVTAERVAHAWDSLGLPRRWQAPQPVDEVDVAFRARFPHVDGAASPVQRAAVDAARSQTQPGLLVIEAPMGSGKTEAALLAAETLAHRSGASGCFVALPTQATSDAMFPRVRDWLEGLPSHEGADPVTVGLAHGKAHLNEAFRDLVRSGSFSGIGDDGRETAAVHTWLSGRKKRLLASFVVATVDQVLLGSLKSKHLVLRHLALASKVVIIDEVHAYDVYMAQYLQRMLHWLGAYRVPVVLLSATLPPERRAELVYAYEGGRKPATELRDTPGYPVVLGSGGLPPRALEAPPAGDPVRLERLPDDPESLVVYLRERLRSGGCAAIVHNTVGRVQDTADRLIAEFGAENVTVDHARFLACDRARIDRDLVRRFGPADSARPELHIVVASQVIEQSLDVDFDLLVTDLAPIDLVLQRMGRMHRHTRERPALLAAPQCALVGVEDWTAVPVRAVPGSRSVYGEHVLLRSAALLLDRDEIVFPADIPELVRAGYGDGELGPPDWLGAMTEAARKATRGDEDRIDEAGKFLLDRVGTGGSLVNWVRAGVGNVDGEARAEARGLAQVRDGGETLEVLVVVRDEHGGLLTPDWIDDGANQQIPTDEEIRARSARIVAACELRLPSAMCHPGVIDDVIVALEINRFPSFDLTPMLKGQLVLALDVDRTARVCHGKTDFHITYDPNRGLIHEQR